MPLRKNKYGAKKTVVFNKVFHSKKEAQRYIELREMQQEKKITRLKLQPRYDIYINNKYIAFYKADFSYRRNGELIVEDVKGGNATKTAVYKLKKKIIEELHGIKITEI